MRRMAAGCLFYCERYVLAGYQPKKPACVGGIGGKQRPGETVFQTAFRETIEELFHTNEIPGGLMQTLEQTWKPRVVLSKNGYTALVYTFDDLKMFLLLCKKHRLRTPIYSDFPTDVTSLLLGRMFDPTAEISHLMLMPIVFHPDPQTFLNKEFNQDIMEILHNRLFRICS